MSRRIAFRLGTGSCPPTEFVEVGEPVWDPQYLKLGIGNGSQTPLWYPRINGNAFQTNPGQFLRLTNSTGQTTDITYATANAIGSLRTSIPITGSHVSVASDAGTHFTWDGNGTFTLPISSQCSPGTVISVFKYSQTNLATFQCQGSDLQNWGGNGGTSIYIGANSGYVEFVLESGNIWDARSGDLQLSQSSSFFHNFSATGYQKQPTGLIKQWGSALTGTLANGVGSYWQANLPWPYPNYMLSAQAALANGAIGNGCTVTVMDVGTPFTGSSDTILPIATPTVISGYVVNNSGSSTKLLIRWECEGY